MAEGNWTNDLYNALNFNDNNILAHLVIYRFILGSAQKVTLTEGTTQRFAIIVIYNSTGSSMCGIYVVDRWGNRHEIHGTTDITAIWTGRVNTLGTLTINNTINGYIGVAVICPPNMYIDKSRTR